MNIAARKRARKEERRMRDREQSEGLRKVAAARKAYEAFHQLPSESCTLEQVSSSSAGIEGWAALAHRVDSQGRWKKEATTIDILTRIPAIGAYSAGVLRPVSKAAAADSDGWEMLEITVDSGACDTVLPSGMLASIQTQSTPASRAMEEYEVANGCVIVNEGEKQCLMMTAASTRCPRASCSK